MAPGGLVRHLVVREARSSGDLALNLYVAARFPEETELAARVAGACDVTSFAVTVNASRADAAVGDAPHLLFGAPYLRERLAGVELAVPLTAFLQTNSAMCEVLYATALRLAAAEPEREAYDLYCGIGSLSLPLARAARQVHAVEIQEEAIVAARENARRNAIANADFRAGDVRRLLKEDRRGAGRRRAASRRARRPAARRHGTQGSAARAALGAGRFVYVSCNPTTLAGNGAELARPRLPARSRRARRHVPADAPRGDRRPVRARGLRRPRPAAAPCAPPAGATWPPQSPEPVGVHGEKGDRQQGERRERLPPQGEHDGGHERRHHRHSTASGAQAEARARRRDRG